MTRKHARKPTCHPDRKHVAKGKCQPCYDKDAAAGWTPERRAMAATRSRVGMAKLRAKDPQRGVASSAEWRALHPAETRAYMRKYQLKKFGLTPEGYAQLLEKQGGLCAICRRPPTGVRLAVDHDHKHGHVRGLLCRACNTTLGQFGDDPERFASAVRYLLLN